MMIMDDKKFYLILGLFIVFIVYLLVLTHFFVSSIRHKNTIQNELNLAKTRETLISIQSYDLYNKTQLDIKKISNLEEKYSDLLSEKEILNNQLNRKNFDYIMLNISNRQLEMSLVKIQNNYDDLYSDYSDIKEDGRIICKKIKNYNETIADDVGC